jgi:hypothetical protein
MKGVLHMHNAARGADSIGPRQLVVYAGIPNEHPSFFKKWWMVEQLLDKHDYMVICDSEVEFIKARAF